MAGDLDGTGTPGKKTPPPQTEGPDPGGVRGGGGKARPREGTRVPGRRGQVFSGQTARGRKDRGKPDKMRPRKKSPGSSGGPRISLISRRLAPPSCPAALGSPRQPLTCSQRPRQEDEQQTEPPGLRPGKPHPEWETWGGRGRVTPPDPRPAPPTRRPSRSSGPARPPRAPAAAGGGARSRGRMTTGPSSPMNSHPLI